MKETVGGNQNKNHTTPCKKRGRGGGMFSMKKFIIY
jgi:hypothetical protein